MGVVRLVTFALDWTERRGVATVKEVVALKSLGNHSPRLLMVARVVLGPHNSGGTCTVNVSSPMATILGDSPLNGDIVRCPSVNEIITRPPTANNSSRVHRKSSAVKPMSRTVVDQWDERFGASRLLATVEQFCETFNWLQVQTTVRLCMSHLKVTQTARILGN